MSFSDKAEFQIPRHIVQKGGVNIEQISGNRTLTYQDSTYQRIDAQSGSLKVILPAEKEGAMFVINCQGNPISVETPALSAIALLSVNEGGMFCCDGSVWKRYI